MKRNLTSEYKLRLVEALFPWRQGYDKVTGENVLACANEHGHFQILWQADSAVEEYTAVINNDITGGDSFDTIEEAKEWCIGYTRGMMLRGMLQFYLLGVDMGRHHKLGDWNVESLAAFLNDQGGGALTMTSAANLDDIVKSAEDAMAYYSDCPCENCAALFDDEESERELAEIEAEEDTTKRVLH